jgi:1-acyl-sn-glycerol-3-phosphate acyltransferase
MGPKADARSLFARARAQIPLEDALGLLTPPGLLVKLAAYALGVNRGDRFAGTDPSLRDPEFLALLLDAFRPVAEHYFRARYVGVEKVPATGPMLLVGNHNGGLLTTESYLTYLALWDRFGPERALYGLAHDVVFDDPTLRTYAGKFGALRASHEAAHEAFAAGHGVLVYPGSDLDSFRSFQDRKRVVFGPRTGFVRLALRERVPIVPTVCAGPQEQWIVLTRGDAIARALHMKRWARTDVFPIVLSLPWGLTSGFVPYLPLPVPCTLAFGDAIAWPELGPEAADDDAVVERCRDEVQAAMQGILDDLYRDRAPFLG